jgi:hypothetical protein
VLVALELRPAQYVGLPSRSLIAHPEYASELR